LRLIDPLNLFSNKTHGLGCGFSFLFLIFFMACSAAAAAATGAVTESHSNHIAVIFASAYPGSPASLFGHTMLRVHRPSAIGDHPLLDEGISFAADVDTDNALVYAIKGLFGGFQVYAESLPYYLRVQKYNNIEERDLWEYDLTVSDFSLLNDQKLRYFYLSKNCSYYLLKSLEVSNPQLDLTSRLKPWVIPSDAVKILWQTPGLVKNVTYRPSKKKQFLFRYQRLSNDDKYLVIEIFKKKTIPPTLAKLSSTKQRDILDTEMDLVEYRHEAATFQKQILDARAAIALSTDELKIPPPENESPHLSHPSTRASVGAIGSHDGDDRWLLGWRPALHDELDPQGFSSDADFSVFDTELSYSRPRHRLELEHFDFLKIVSRPLWRVLAPDPSWRFRLGVEKMQDLNCYRCHGGVIDGGWGVTMALNQSGSLRFSPGLRGLIEAPFTGNHRQVLFGGGPDGRLVYRVSKDLAGEIQGWYRWDVDQSSWNDWTSSAALQWRNFKISGTNEKSDRQIRLDLFYYY
jgi:hypothetical protein